MPNEREAIMEKARTKRERRAEVTSARNSSRRRKDKAFEPDATLTEKVIDLAQGAVTRVGDFVKAAADKFTETAAVVEPSSEQKTP